MKFTKGDKVTFEIGASRGYPPQLMDGVVVWVKGKKVRIRYNKYNKYHPGYVIGYGYVTRDVSGVKKK